MKLLINSKIHGLKVCFYDDNQEFLVNQYKWRLLKGQSTFYAQTWTPMIKGKRKIIKMHNLLTGFKFVDHIDGNGLNNTLNNLREANHKLNAQNRHKSSFKTRSSKYKGVFYNKYVKNLKKRWCARIVVNGKWVWLGSYKTELEAAKAYESGAKQYFQTYAFYND